MFTALSVLLFLITVMLFFFMTTKPGSNRTLLLIGMASTGILSAVLIMAPRNVEADTTNNTRQLHEFLISAGILNHATNREGDVQQYTCAANTVTDGGLSTSQCGTFDAGTKLLPTKPVVLYSCLDREGCNAIMSEVGINPGRHCTIINVGGYTVNFADTSNVSDLAGSFAAGPKDSISLVYVTDRDGGQTGWVEVGRSNN